AGTLVLRTDPVPAPDRGERRGVLLLDEHFQTVVEGRAAHHRIIIKSWDTRLRAFATAAKPMPESNNTVNRPRTDFPMKANLPASEPETLARWLAMDLYGRLRDARRGAPKFILHDGPPYANGSIHIGTALNKILKDLVVKSRSMAGYDAPYVVGY